MFTLRVNFLEASLPSIPGNMVLFLFFGFAMSSTMTAPFLDHVVRDRECIQSQLVKLSSGFAFNQKLSASAGDNSLIPIVITLYFWFCFAQLELLCIAQFADHLLRVFAERTVDVILLQVGLKRSSMRMTFDLFDELLNTEMFCIFHNCM